MRVAYLVYIENPNTGLFKSQVLGLLDELALDREIEISLVAIWQPWIYFKNYKDIVTLKNKLRKENVRLVSIPLGLPGRYFFENKALLSLNTLYIYTVLKLVRINEYDIVHGRGFFISYVAALLKGKFKLIFDLRSFFVEENISTGKWNKKDLIYKKWKEIERYTVQKADHAVVVSRPMIQAIDYLKNNIRYIPIGFNEKDYQVSAIHREKIRKELGVNNKKVIVYSGSLQLNFWNDLSVYAKYFTMINEFLDDVHFLILTNSDHENIVGYFIDCSVHNFSILNVKPHDIPVYLSAADVGIQVMNKMEDSQSRFGVKVVEYWASGLPVITNKNVGGICNLIEENNYLGVVLDTIDDLNDLSYDKTIEIKKFAVENFSFKKVAKDYLSLYLDNSTPLNRSEGFHSN